MSRNLYRTGGPLIAGSECYVARDADHITVEYLRRMEYITLVEPRQQGKTSLINSLIGKLSTQRFAFSVRDLTAAKSSGRSPVSWYSSVGSWLSRQFKFIPESRRPAPPVDCSSWEGFLAVVAEQAECAEQNVVIVLDEVGAIPEDLATEFFSVIRSIYTTRQSFSFWKHLTFIISGAFNPKDLINDKAVSNFNVDQRVVLRDFDIAQVEKLVDLLNLPGDQARMVAQRIHYWTDGQPYLAEHLCSYLATHRRSLDVAGVESTVDEAVEHFFYEDTHHLSRIGELTARPELLEYTRKITRVPRARFSASLNDKHFRLAHILGVIKADGEGRCCVRNRIYERALRESEQGHESRPAAAVAAAMPRASKRFRVAFSFPGEHRDFVSEAAALLARQLGQHQVFYDKYHESELARPNLDTYLQRIYRDDSELIAVFLCADYERKKWCGLEWRALRDLIAARQDYSIMPFRFDNTEIPGLFSIDGYISVGDRGADEIACLILQRLFRSAL